MFRHKRPNPRQHPEIPFKVEGLLERNTEEAEELRHSIANQMRDLGLAAENSWAHFKHYAPFGVHSNRIPDTSEVNTIILIGPPSPLNNEHRIRLFRAEFIDRLGEIWHLVDDLTLGERGTVQYAHDLIPNNMGELDPKPEIAMPLVRGGLLKFHHAKPSTSTPFVQIGYPPNETEVRPLGSWSDPIDVRYGLDKANDIFRPISNAAPDNIGTIAGKDLL